MFAKSCTYPNGIYHCFWLTTIGSSTCTSHHWTSVKQCVDKEYQNLYWRLNRKKTLFLFFVRLTCIYSVLSINCIVQILNDRYWKKRSYHEKNTDYHLTYARQNIRLDGVFFLHDRTKDERARACALYFFFFVFLISPIISVLRQLEMFLLWYCYYFLSYLDLYKCFFFSLLTNTERANSDDSNLQTLLFFFFRWSKEEIFGRQKLALKLIKNHRTMLCSLE